MLVDINPHGIAEAISRSPQCCGSSRSEDVRAFGRHPSRQPRNEPTSTLQHALLNRSSPLFAPETSIITMAGYVQYSSSPRSFESSWILAQWHSIDFFFDQRLTPISQGTFPGLNRPNNVPHWQRLHQTHDGVRQWNKVR